MWLTTEHLGRLAVSAIIAVLGFIALHNSCGLIPEVIVWWLLYVVGCGVVLNTSAGESPQILARLAVLPASIPIAMAIFFRIAGFDLCLSLPNPVTLIMLPVVSWFSIVVFSYARNPLIAFVKWSKDGASEQDIKKIVTAIQLILGGAAAIALAASVLGSKTIAS